MGLRLQDSDEQVSLWIKIARAIDKVPVTGAVIGVFTAPKFEAKAIDGL